MNDPTIRIGIIGVGNCASSLIQSLTFYQSAQADQPMGLRYPELNGYRIRDIKPVFAVDIDARKVGIPLYQAIQQLPNNTPMVCSPKPDNSVIVCRGRTLDGVSPLNIDLPEDRRIVPSERPEDPVKDLLKESRVDFLLNYLPVGSHDATAYYMDLACTCGTHVINCMPEFIASNKVWEQRFAEEHLVIIGDDIRSQLGATVLHQTLVQLFQERGIAINSTYQLNVGGNTDFANMRDPSRLGSKRISKTSAVNRMLNTPLSEDRITIGPSDYVPQLHDEKRCFIRVSGTGFLNNPIDLELRLSVNDSPNSAGIVVDTIRLARCALDLGLKGAIQPICQFAMKHPPESGIGIWNDAIASLVDNSC